MANTRLEATYRHTDDGLTEVDATEKIDGKRQFLNAAEPPNKQRKIEKVVKPRLKGRADLVPEDDLKDAMYYFEHGLRKVQPYFYKYQTFAKGRWIGRTILNIFETEFQDRTKEYYEYAIKKGLITVNDDLVQTSRIINNKDIITHNIHRHEAPVTADPIRIVYETEDYVVVNKPGSIPVHPTGRYRHNTLTHILQKENGFPKLHLNRLDRLTSGLVILALNVDKAQEFVLQMSSRNIQKEYVCRVLGEFPKEEIICTEKVLTYSHKLGVNCVDPTGKDCTTIFLRKSYNGRTSVVHCRPLTGRTHQIRVHLQWLGHPIANDPLYCNKRVWGPVLGKGGLFQEDARKTVLERLAAMEDRDEAYWNGIGGGEGGVVLEKGAQQSFCAHCSIQAFEDPRPDQLHIWLHAMKYQGEGWNFEIESPAWAKEDFDGDIEILEQLKMG